jgi:hypothetical protein
MAKLRVMLVQKHTRILYPQIVLGPLHPSWVGPPLEGSVVSVLLHFSAELLNLQIEVLEMAARVPTTRP